MYFTSELDQFHVLIHPARPGLKGFNKWIGFPVFLVLAPIILLVNNLLVVFITSKKPPKINGEILALLDSLNNFHALKFLQNHFKVVFGMRKPIPLVESISAFTFSDYRKPTTSLKSYLFIIFIAFSRKYQASQFWEMFWYFDIKRSLNKDVFQKSRPKAVITSNDHTPFSRGIIQICHEQDIPCFYIQHAAVSHVFPPLLFTASFLYGKKSLEIYEKCGPLKGETYLVGHHKFDEYHTVIPKKVLTKKIAVCINKFNELEIVSSLVKNIYQSFPDMEVIVRLHPRQKEIDSSLFEGMATLNSAAKQTSADFLKGVDVVIGDNSSILLEAAIMNSYALQTPLSSSSTKDYYGFIEEGVVDFANDQDQVVALINKYYKKPIFPRSRAVPFDASIGSPWEFNVETEIVKHLEQFGVKAHQ